LDLTFYGVRGSTPCAGESTARYGGNTASVVVSDPGHDPILFDLGTGVRYFGKTFPAGEPINAHALVTHLHWDHVQGLPFCRPLLVPGSTLTAYGPAHDGVDFGEAFDHLMRPPFFPVRVRDLKSDIRFATIVPGEPQQVAGAVVTAAYVPHTDTTVGYRVERDGVSIAYVSDHQQPVDDPEYVDAAVLELCQNVDVLIHDAQYTPEEFETRQTWGHCTISYAVHVAAEAAARCLVLFHHDPEHDDATLDRLTLAAVAEADRRGVPQVIAAAEGLHLSVVAPSEVAEIVAAPVAGRA
jgi:phosphoribosyl 1,2-cyclic phosphodiesterase